MKPAGERTSIGTAMAWFVLSYVGAVLGSLGINAVAGRWLGPSDFGLFVAVVTFASLLGQIALLGSHRAGLRELARLRLDYRPQDMAVLRNCVRAVNITTLPLAGVVAGSVTWVVAAGTAVDRFASAVGVGLLVVLSGQQQLWANYVRGLGHVRFAGLLEGRSGGALVVSLQALLLILAWQLAPSWGLAGAVLAIAAGFILPVLLSRRLVRAAWKGLDEPRPRTLRDLRFTFRRDWRFMSVQVATFLNVSTEIWIATLMLSNDDTSMYTAGQRLALLLVLPLTVLQVVFAPVIARTAREKRSDGSLEVLVRTGATVATVLSVALALPMLVAPATTLTLVFGPGFQAAAPVLMLLSLAYLGNVVTGPAGTVLSMLGREGVAAKIQWTGAVLRVGIGVPAAAEFGLLGLTASAVTVSCVVFLTMWWAAHRECNIYTHATLRPRLRLLRQIPG
jgi:O-antigen/teichoic acid export membrane protein